MVVDTSALIAVMANEPDAQMLSSKIMAADAVMASPSLLEASMVLTKFPGIDPIAQLTLTLSDLGITVVPFTPDQAWEATSAFERFGKGRHPAALNFGDCIVYGLAKATGRPVLFTGGDFSKTDIGVA